MCVFRHIYLLRNLIIQSAEQQIRQISRSYVTNSKPIDDVYDLTTKPFLVFASIGNPEPEYRGTRHNLGHWLLEELIKSHWQHFSTIEKYGGTSQLISSRSGDFSSVLLYKSTDSYMNVQGVPIGRMWRDLHNKKRSTHSPALVVIHDELSVPLGKFQIRRRNTSPRGHNGLRSIDKSVGQSYTKISIGIGKSNGNITQHVLTKFNEDEKHILLHDVFPKVFEVLDQMKEGKYIYESSK